jgi:hypothetical protein
MDDREKALELVQKCLDDWPYAATRVVDIMKRLEQVKVLLKSQEPVEPTLRGGIGGYWYCGACDYQISRGDKYCRYCGRAVKWG